MTTREGLSLDRYITGNYGEDQYKQCSPYEADFVEDADGWFVLVDCENEDDALIGPYGPFQTRTQADDFFRDFPAILYR